MKKYSGRLDGLFGPIVRGWVMPADGGAEKPTVSLFVDGKVIGRVAADQRRVDLVVKGVGDGCHGFSFDLRSAPRIADDALIVVSVEDVEAPMPLGAVKVGSEADGRIERLDNGWLIGWAHGPRFRPVRLGIYRNGVLAVAWPCNHVRGDLAAKGIGSGRHGFRIPLEGLLPQSPHTTLTFRLLPGDLVLPPCQPMQDSSVLQPRFRLEALGKKAVDVRQLKAAVIECLVNGKDLAKSDDAVLIAPALLNEILNRLSAAEASAVTFDQHVAFKRTATERPPASAAQSDKRQSWQGSIGANLAAIVERSEHFGGDEIVAQIEKDIMPTYRDSLIERKYLAAAIETLDDPKLLRALTTAFRKHDFYHVPIEAYRRSLDFAPSVDPSNFKYLNIISGWSRGDQLTSPQHLKPIAVAQRKRKRVLYVLWRSVPYDTNGYATRSHYLLRSFRQIGEDVVAATRFGYPWDAEHKKSAQAHTEVIDDVLYIHHGGSNASRDTLSLDEYVSECAERLAMTAASVGADIIHSASNWVAALPALRAARLLGLPFCYEIRGLWEVTRASNVPGYDKTDHYELFRNMEGYVARQADQVFAITRQVMAEMGRRGADTSRMLLAPNGVELERFSPKSIDRELATSLGITNEVVFGYIGLPDVSSG